MPETKDTEAGLGSTKVASDRLDESILNDAIPIYETPESLVGVKCLRVKKAARALYTTIREECSHGRDRALALTHLEDASTRAIKAIYNQDRQDRKSVEAKE